MSMFQFIKTEQLTARKARQSVRANLLTTLLGEFARARVQSEPTDKQVFAAATSMANSIKETIEKQSADENTDKLVEELSICNEILALKPLPATEVEIQAAIEAELQLNPNAAIGELMPALKAKLGDRLDGKLASALIKSLAR